MNKQLRKSSAFLATAALLGSLALPAKMAEADVTMNVGVVVASSIVETVVTNMDFGSLDLVPAGDLIRIDASAAAATPAAVAPSNGSVITGGTSGLVTVDADINVTIAVTYPADNNVVVTDGTTTVYLNGISTYSTGGPINHTGGTTTNIHVGGQLEFTGVNATEGTYTGSFLIQLNYS